MADEQLPLLALPEAQPKPGPTWPTWFNGDANGTPATHRDRVRRGLHPFGFPLAPEGHPGHGETCRTCSRRRGQGYIKCQRLRPGEQTHGPGTDLRLKWAACDGWQPREKNHA